jgi:hypothetical protein
MFRIVAAFLISLAISSEAKATGGFSCTADDANLQFEAESALGSIASAPILNLKAHAKPRMKGTPPDLQELDLKMSLAHSWMIPPELRLHFYMEREGEQPHGTFELIVLATASDDEGNYAGTYTTTIFYTEPPANAVEGAYLRANGKVTCFVE